MSYFEFFFQKPKAKKWIIILQAFFILCSGTIISLIYLSSNSAFSSVYRARSFKDYVSEKLSQFIVVPDVLELDASLNEHFNRLFLKDSKLPDFKSKEDLPINSSCLGQLGGLTYSEATKADELLVNDKNIKTILVWHAAYNEKTCGYGSGMKPFQEACCKETRCFITANRRLLPQHKFDAIIFQLRGLKEIPVHRSTKQRWIFLETESASYVYEDPRQFDYFFNWTMTYRRDSDIFLRYGLVLPKNMYPLHTDDPSKSSDSISFATGKKKQIAWFVSNCKSMSYRENFVQQLSKYIQVDIYGKCGTKNCSRDSSEECYSMIEKEYKFYLSFENSLCKDYVTEKLFNILRRNIIPVVYGFGNYEVQAPPHSYINALSFSSVQELSDYLLYLDKNDTAYNEYFKWKKDYNVIDFNTLKAFTFCSLCKKLHEDIVPSSYKDMDNWFVTKSHCRRLLPVSWLEWIFDQTPIKLWPSK